jgi:hypothetical protein
MKYASKPVVFIAVNSGNPRAVVEEYAKSTKFEWPILVDELRETEAKYGRKISLSNVCWFFVVAPDGTYQEFGADVGRAEKHLQELLPKARTLFDGIRVPPELRPVTRRLEAGQRGEPVHELFKIALGESAESEPARKMFERLQSQGDARLKRAGELKEKEDRVGAFDAFSDLERDFPGTPLAREAHMEVEKLRPDKDVRAELQARGILDQARAALGKGKPGRAQAKMLLEGLIGSFPKAPSAETARRLLKTIEDGGKK